MKNTKARISFLTIIGVILFSFGSCGSNSPQTTADDGGTNVFLDGAASFDLPAAVCGNGIIDVGETCDKAIAAGSFGACPTDCNDQAVCTKDTVVGSECNKTCLNEEILTCDTTQSDKCCPKNCSTTTDIDCGPYCGNAIVDPNEICDKAIAEGEPGACPKSCDDNNNCTEDKSTGAECTVACSHTPIATCSNQIRDRCCPAGCNMNIDLDCYDLCGNGVLDPGELCDTKILNGTGACPNSKTCTSPLDGCQSAKLLGSDCLTRCYYSPISKCSLLSDGCCPPQCSGINDPDCLPTPDR